MAQIAGKYDLDSDEQRAAYGGEISALLAALPNEVERDIYSARAAETARITPEAMRLDVERARKKKVRRDGRTEERKSLNPAAQVQPKERSMRYENLRSARAEEGMLRLLVLDDSLFPPQPPVREEQFSSPLLGRAFFLLWRAREEGRTVTLAALDAELAPEEMSHITSVCQQPESAKNGSQALADYISVILEEWNRKHSGGEDPLAAAIEKSKNKKGTGGKLHG